jgi:UDP-GlcNAc:undecaprenyl-phosphate GlcNAc-1-phosphate transferase
MYSVILGFITAFAITYFVIPLIIKVAKERRLYDRPNERSAHKEPTPSLGGIGIFAGAVCGIVLWTPLLSFSGLQYILAAFVMIFLIGVMDDLLPLSPTKKIVSQLLVAVVLVYKGRVELTSLYGLLGIGELPELTSFILSIVVIIAIVNAFNLIDGINGLAGSIGLLTCVAWGCWFYAVGDAAMPVLAFSLAGAIVAFLRYNVTPAKIFMGDTGSLLIGTVSAILAIKFIEANKGLPAVPWLHFPAAPAIAIGVLILPLYDTLRVFVCRLWEGRSPFYPDKNHIHHLLLDLGLSHMRATVVLVVVNGLFIAGAVALSGLGTAWLLLVELVLAYACTELLQRFSRRRRPPTAPEQLAT